MTQTNGNESMNEYIETHHCGLDAGADTPAPGSPGHGVGISESEPSHVILPTKVAQEKIREGIRMERDRVIRLLMSERYRRTPSEDAAMVIHNGIHWGPDYE